MFAWGLVLVGVGEVALSISGRAGPLLAIISRSDWRPALRFVTFAATIGVLYETCNFYFPFWVWLPNGVATAFPADSATNETLGPIFSEFETCGLVNVVEQ